jgi:hypothetical protein
MPKTGPELVDEVGKINTLDVLLDRYPDDLVEADYQHMVATERANRARWIIAQDVKKEKKAGVPQLEELDDATSTD